MKYKLKGIYSEEIEEEEIIPCFLKLEETNHGISIRCVNKKGESINRGYIATFKKINGKYQLYREPGVNKELPFELDSCGKIVSK